MATIVQLRSKRQRRAVTVQKFQHIVPAVPLLSAGLETLRHDPHGLALLLGIFEIGTSVLLLGTIVRELRSLRRGNAHDAHASHSPHAVDWFHIFAAAMLLAETAEHWHVTHHWRRPTLVTAAFTLLLGLLHGRIDAWSHDRRSLRIEDEGISVGGRPFRTFSAKWTDVARIDVSGRFGIIRTRGGRERKIDLHDCEDAGRVRAALIEAQSRVRIPENQTRP